MHWTNIRQGIYARPTYIHRDDVYIKRHHGPRSRSSHCLLYRIGQNILHKSDIECGGTGSAAGGGTRPLRSAAAFHKRYVGSVA